LATNLSFPLPMGKHSLFLSFSLPLLLFLSSLWLLGLLSLSSLWPLEPLFPPCLFLLLASFSQPILSPSFLWLLWLLWLLFLPCPFLLLVSFSPPILSASGRLLPFSFERPLLVFVPPPLPFSLLPAASSLLLTSPMLWVVSVEEVLRVLKVVVLLLAPELVGLLAVEVARLSVVELAGALVVELAGLLVAELAGPEAEVQLVVGVSEVEELFAAVGQLEDVVEV